MKALIGMGIAVPALVGIAAVVLAVCLAIGPGRPGVMESIRAPVVQQDYGDLPPVATYTAREGTALAYRFYPSTAGKIAVLIHGSAAHGRSMHALARYLAQHGIAQGYALDIRGHGASGPRGDIAYIGQLEDDLADFLALARSKHPGLPVVLVGFSSGGGFALRVAGSPLGERFDAYILLSPYLRYDAPTARRASGGWASVSIPRIVALTLLDRFHIRFGQHLRVVEFAVADAERDKLTPSYTYALNANFAPHRRYEDDLKRATKPIALLAGSADEVFVAERYADAVKPFAPGIAVELVPGVSHTGMTVQPEALAAIGRTVARLP